MKILALGATGAIGREMIVSLDPYQHDIYVTTRHARDTIGPVRYIQGDALNETFLRRLLRQDWDVIVDFMVYDTLGFLSRSDALLGATGQYVFTSSARVFAGSSDLLTERSPRILDVQPPPALLDDDEYALTKARQEDLLHESGRRNWTIVRPYITFGKGRLQLGTLEKEGWLYRALKGRSIVFCEPLMEKWTTMTDGKDVARMISALIGNTAALGEDFNLTSRHAITWCQVLAVYLSVLEMHIGQRPRVSLLTLENFCRTVRSTAPVRYDRMYNRRFDTSKVDALTKLDNLANPLSALQHRLEAELADEPFLCPDWSTEARRDKAVNERAPLSEMSSSRARLAYISHRYFPDRVVSMLR